MGEGATKTRTACILLDAFLVTVAQHNKNTTNDTRSRTGVETTLRLQYQTCEEDVRRRRKGFRFRV